MSAPSEVERRRFTADEVYKMLDAGILSPDERVELLDGELVTAAAQGPVHVSLGVRIARLLERRAGRGAHARLNAPINAGPHSLPEPDVCLVEGSPDDYLSHHPGGAEILVAVEVAVTALAEARRKVPIYARGSVSQLWILDVPSRRVEVYQDPRPDGRYGSRRDYGPDETLPFGPASEPIPVASLLPPPDLA